MKQRMLNLLEDLYGLFPLRFLGIALALAAWYGFEVYGQGKADYVYYMGTLTLLLVVAVALVFVLLASLTLAIWLQIYKPAEKRYALQVGLEHHFEEPFPRFLLWPFVEVEWSWWQPKEAQLELERRGRWVYERVTLLERGNHPAVVRRFTVRDIFGLASISFRKRWPQAIVAAPALIDFNVVVAPRNASGDALSDPHGEPVGDRVEMRRYAPGDPLRLVLWKVYARTRKLMVRTPERAIAPKKSVVAFMLAGRGDEPSATTARSFLEARALGEDFRFMADGAATPTQENEDSLEQIISSVGHRQKGGQGLAQLVEQIGVEELNNTIIFLPARRGPWLQHLKAFAQMVPQPPTLVLSFKGELDLGPRKMGSLLFARPPQRQQKESGRMLAGLHEELVALGGEVILVDAQSGQRFDPSLLWERRER